MLQAGKPDKRVKPVLRKAGGKECSAWEWRWRRVDGCPDGKRDAAAA